MPDVAASKFTATQAAVVKQAAPYFGAMQTSFLLAEPAALVVPVTRRLVGRAGVQAGPVVLPIVNAFVVALLRRLQRSGRLSDQIDRAELDVQRPEVWPIPVMFPRL